MRNFYPWKIKVITETSYRGEILIRCVSKAVGDANHGIRFFGSCVNDAGAIDG
jgi:hypothetical protein